MHRENQRLSIHDSAITLASTYGRQIRVNCLHVKRFRVEFATDLFHHVFVFGVFRVLDFLQEVTIAPRSATVIRWGRSFAIDAARVMGAFFGGNHLFHLDCVVPIVAEVVKR